MKLRIHSRSPLRPISPHSPYHLSADQMEHFRSHGYVHLRSHYSRDQQAALRTWVDAMQQWAETPFAFMQYFETAAGRRTLCRMEYLLDYHDGLRDLCRHPQLLHPLTQLFGEPAVLFKEKINFKLPGGQGFAAHQDAPAFATFGQRYHITAMVSIDPSSELNGCLEIAEGAHAHVLLPQTSSGVLDPSYEKRMRFRPVATAPGDVVLFDSYVPHRSGANRSQSPRRALYLTYNGQSAGDQRLSYYRDKRENFPPDCERVPGRDYSAGAAIYNIANPIHP